MDFGNVEFFNTTSVEYKVIYPIENLITSQRMIMAVFRLVFST